MTPSQKGIVQAYAKEIGIAAALLAAAGYAITSPKEQIEHLTVRIEQSISAQTARDASQDDRIAELKANTEGALRIVGEDVRDLIIATCLKATDRTVYARLNCKQRLGR
jgi:hypothetical protein